jgi:hypothetical protein
MRFANKKNNQKPTKPKTNQQKRKMKKIIYSVAAFICIAAFSNSASAQLTDEQNVNITLDMQPILKLDMSTSSDVNFTFNTIAGYAGGIIKYGATVLKVSSSVGWVLYAEGTSQTAQSAGGLPIMDNPVNYNNGGVGGSLGIPVVPLDALELHQYQLNLVQGVAVGNDYSTQFLNAATLIGAPGTGTNNIDYLAAADPYNVTNVARMIEGSNAAGSAGVGGSWLTAPIYSSAALPATNAYTFTIDYRILPSLPVVFPASAYAVANSTYTATPGNYATPGVYTMDVKYVLEQAQ